MSKNLKMKFCTFSYILGTYKGQKFLARPGPIIFFLSSSRSGLKNSVKKKGKHLKMYYYFYIILYIFMYIIIVINLLFITIIIHMKI